MTTRPPDGSPGRLRGFARAALERLLLAIRGRVWIVGRVEGQGIKYLLGAYATEAQAAARCRTPFDVIGPVRLGDLPEVAARWEGHRWPVAERLAREEVETVLARRRAQPQTPDSGPADTPR